MNLLKTGGSMCHVETTKLEDGLHRYLVYTKGDTAHFHELTKEEQQMALEWVSWNVCPAQSPCNGHTSYGMKAILHRRTNIYMTENQFKECMLLAGFRPQRVNEQNWVFLIRKSSPMFQTYKDGRSGIPMLGEPMKYETA